MTPIKKPEFILSISMLLLLTACYWMVFKARAPKQNTRTLAPQSTAAPVRMASLKTTTGTAALVFFENKGQFDSKHHIRYILESNGVVCLLKPDGITYSFARVETDEKPLSKPLENTPARAEISSLHMSWKGANPNVRIRAEEQALEVRNYYTSGTAEGITGVKSYKKVVYEELYKHIDLVLYSHGNQLKYDFVVKPGGNVKDIQLSYSGNTDLQLNDKGELLIEGKLGTLTEGKPYTYQTLNGTETEIASKYLVANQTIRFQVEAYDPNQALIIDPTLLWATYYGGDDNGAYKYDEGLAVCTDHQGNVYMAGRTASTGLAYNGHDEILDEPWDGQGGILDAFLVKFDASGNRLWATYYGGTEHDEGTAVCTDPAGNVFLAGYTQSNSNIAHLGHDNIYNEDGGLNGDLNDRDAFLVKFNANGQRSWATYYGGEDGKPDAGTGVCSDANGNIFLTGYSKSTTGIAQGGYDNTLSGFDYTDAFLVKFSNGGTRQWATYFGGDYNEEAKAVCADAWGNVYITGYTQSANLVSGGHDVVHAGSKDAFLETVLKGYGREKIG